MNETLGTLVDQNTTRFTRRFTAEIDVVWSALTDPSVLGLWFLPDPTVELSPNGRWSFGSPHGPHYTGNVGVFDPPRQIRYEYDDGCAMEFVIAARTDGSILWFDYRVPADFVDDDANTDDVGCDQPAGLGTPSPTTCATWHTCLEALQCFLEGMSGDAVEAVARRAETDPEAWLALIETYRAHLSANHPAARLFGSRAAADPPLSLVLKNIRLDSAAELLQELYEGERSQVEHIFRDRLVWADIFAALAPFAGRDPDAVAAEHLAWRGMPFIWNALLRFRANDVRDRVVIEGRHHADALASRTTRYFIVSFHIRDYTLLGTALAAAGLSPAAVGNFSRRPNVPTSNRLISASDPFSLLRVRNALDDGSPVLIMPDILRGGSPVMESASFMGEQVLMASSWHLLAMRLGVAILPCYAVVGSGMSTRLVFGAPSEPPTTEDEAREAVQRLYTFFGDALDDRLVEWSGWTECVWQSVPDSASRILGASSWSDALQRSSRARDTTSR